MHRSIYLSVAVFFIRMDLQRSRRAQRRKQRCIIGELPLNNTYLLRDIGLEQLYPAQVSHLSLESMVSVRSHSLRRLLIAKYRRFGE